MAYQGWSREEMLRTGHIIENTSNLNPPTKRPKTYFTPINNYPTETLSLQHALLAEGLDSDSLYNLPEEDMLTMARKRSHAQLAKSTALSHTRAWKSLDEVASGPGVEENLPNWQKAPSIKQAQWMKKPTVPILSEVLESEDESANSKGVRPKHSPPALRKRNQRVAVFIASSSKRIANTMFKNPTITKPPSSRSKELADMINTSQHICQFQRFNTTEDLLKSSSNALSQTTMAKLNSFRLRSMSTESYEFTQKSVDYAAESQLNILVNESSYLPSNPQNPDDDKINDIPAENGPNMVHIVCRSPQQHTPASTLLVDEIPFSIALPTAFSLDVSKTGGQENRYERLPNLGMPEMLRSTGGVSQDNIHYKEPNLSQAMIVTEILSSVDFIEPGLPSVELPHVIPTQDTTMRGYSTISDRPFVDNERIVEQTASGRASKARASCFDVVERFDTEQEPVPDVQHDLRDDEEFCDGLDDYDLIAIMGGITIPPTASKPHSLLSDEANGCTPSGFQPSKPLENPETISTNPRGNVILHSSQIRQGYMLSSVSPLSANSVGDDFPMDDGDEDHLLSFLDPVSKINEGFIPPLSVQYDFDDQREVYDSFLQFSPPKSRCHTAHDNCFIRIGVDARPSPKKDTRTDPIPVEWEEDGSFICSRNHVEDAEPLPVSSAYLRPQKVAINATSSPLPTKRTSSDIRKAHISAVQEARSSTWLIIDDSHEYEPLGPFVRPPFLPLVLDRCPVLGISARTFLRTCFRIGEMFQQGTKCDSQGLDAVIELFARVNFSSREPGTTKQHFQFLDLWHDRGPYPNGILENYKSTGLAESESKVFLDLREKKHARVLGRLRRDKKNEAWWLQVINIRETDWEEVRWTRRIVSGDDLTKKRLGLELFRK